MSISCVLYKTFWNLISINLTLRATTYPSGIVRKYYLSVYNIYFVSTIKKSYNKKYVEKTIDICGIRVITRFPVDSRWNGIWR